jgi:hypothetical protein
MNRSFKVASILSLSAPGSLLFALYRAQLSYTKAETGESYTMLSAMILLLPISLIAFLISLILLAKQRDKLWLIPAGLNFIPFGYLAMIFLSATDNP